MEGALPGVVGGLVDKPIIAVPTSVGYGAAFDGVAALLGMMTSCASGVSVVNIDNGFGAGFLANRINRLCDVIYDPGTGTKVRRAEKIIRDYGSAVVAFSGGIDSSLVAYVAGRVLGEKALAVTSGSASLKAQGSRVLKSSARTGVSHIRSS